MGAHTRDELAQYQSLPLDAKILMSQQRIRDWYRYWGGKVYISFSGGKDSTVLLDLVRGLFPDIPAVFVDTGLEFPEIKEFVKTKDNVTILRPKMSFRQVIEKYGYPVFSKDVAHSLEYGQKGCLWAIKRFEGLNKDGTSSKFKESYIKYKKYLDAPFKISDHCCDMMKKKPIKEYEKEHESVGFLGTMADESFIRLLSWMQHGCNAFDATRPSSRPRV